MCSYHLAPHVGFGFVEGRTVLLDLRRDRYLLLEGEAGEAFSRLCLGSPNPAGDEPALKRLVEAQLLLSLGIRAPIKAARSFIPERSALDAAGPRKAAGLSSIAAAWRATSRAARDLRRLGLEIVVAGVRDAKRAASGESAAGARDAASTFAAARRLVPRPPNCLCDSIALSRYMARRDIFPELVFGVKLNPFAAHCWLQSDVEILNDRIENVGKFTPVLVV